MKNYIKQLLRENLLKERLTEVDTDVNLLYDMFFKNDIEQMEQTDILTRKMFDIGEASTDILQSEEAKKAHALNPCKIVINHGNNYYNPIEKLISLSVSDNALSYVLYRHEGSLKKAIDSLYDIPSQQNNLPKEFSEVKLKGTIHHELAHWIDDTLNNKHLTKRIEKQIASDTRNLKGIPVNTTKMEIQGQIHNIKQTYEHNKDIWDEISFYKLMNMVPSLNVVFSELKYQPKFRKQWVRDIKTRMSREGLLGKNMNY